MSFLDQRDADELPNIDEAVAARVDADNAPVPEQKPEPLYRIYRGARIAVGSGVGKMWQTKLEAAIATYQPFWDKWNTVLDYYNFDQFGELETPRGTFKRGDSSENIVYSNVNVLLSAVYSKNPDVTCNTIDGADDEFCKASGALATTLIRRKDKLNAKAKVKRAAGFGILTDMGVLKLGFTQKADSREEVTRQLEEITTALATVKDVKEAEKLHGKLLALEEQMEVSEPSGPRLANVLPQNIVVDPYAQQPDGMDANWIAEKVYILTEVLNARFTEQDEETQEARLIYKPTHKASFDANAGEREDTLGLILTEIDARGTDPVSGHSTEERLGYIYQYYTECWYIWDKSTRQVYLFQANDFKWPVWVEADPYKLTRFFPYYFIGYSFSTGGIVQAGEVSRYVDHQDDVNDINRTVAIARRGAFDLFLFNADKANEDEVIKFTKAIRGVRGGKKLLGVKAGDSKITDMIESFFHPALKLEPLFNKQPSFEAINRQSSTNEALRGQEFKTNTNTSAVNSYQDSLRMAIGAKVDVIEEAVSDIAASLIEMCVQFYDDEDIIGLIGEELAKGWKKMTVPELAATYSLEVVAGSMEKQNSIFKKKEAVQIAQAVGQFAQGAPVSTFKIMLKVLSRAFTEVNIKPEDWAMIDKEAEAVLARGKSDTSQGTSQGITPEQEAQLQNAPPEFQQKVMQAKAQGASPQQIVSMLQQYLQTANQGGAASSET